jgi:arginase family enzyme
MRRSPKRDSHLPLPAAVPTSDTAITDLGNVIPGQTAGDTYFALAEIVAAVLRNDSTLIILGGSQDLTFAAYKGYELCNRILNIAAIDSRFDLENNDEITSRTWLRNIIMQQPNYLFDYVNLGYQTYFVGQEMVQLMEELKFSTHRVGELQGNLELAEPMVRYSDVVAVDVGAVRQSDAPAASSPSPHGFYGEQLCQLARYAGMSDKTTCFGLFEMVPAHDRDEQTAHMLAHAVWFFIEGFCYRLGDHPSTDRQSFKRFTVQMNDNTMEIVFYKSLKSDRWWMEVPCDDSERRERYLSHTLIPCSYADYEHAMQNEIPPLWWHYYNRFNG